MAHEICKTLVVELKLIDYQYFMDELEEWEVYLLYDSLKYAKRSEWEMTRLLMYVTAQVNSKKRIDIKDILSFPWDEGYEEHNTEMTDEEKNTLRMRAKAMEKLLQQQNG